MMNIKDIRIGYGFDLHRLAPGRKLILGGVELPFELGLLGHSDADALLHAITDALLGALALGDIGTHFPDTDPAYKDADSRKLLVDAYKLIQQRGFIVQNLDCTVIAEAPKLKPHIEKIRQSIAEILQTEVDRVSVKATTSEKIGALGRQEGISATCCALLVQEH